MVVLIDYHTEEPAGEIAPEDWLALIDIGEPGQQHNLIPGWKRLLTLEFLESSAPGTQDRFTVAHAERIGEFWDGLVDERSPLALAIRCGREGAGLLRLQRLWPISAAFAWHHPSPDTTRKSTKLCAPT